MVLPLGAMALEMQQRAGVDATGRGRRDGAEAHGAAGPEAVDAFTSLSLSPSCLHASKVQNCKRSSLAETTEGTALALNPSFFKSLKIAT